MNHDSFKTRITCVASGSQDTVAPLRASLSELRLPVEPNRYPVGSDVALHPLSWQANLPDLSGRVTRHGSRSVEVMLAPLSWDQEQALLPLVRWVEDARRGRHPYDAAFFTEAAKRGRATFLHEHSLAVLWREVRGEVILKSGIHVVQSRENSAELAPVIIGRDPSSDVVVKDGRVSRQHAAILRDARTAAYQLMDRGSRSGTLVNGERLLRNEVRVLVTGDVVSLGGAADFRFLFPADFFGRLLKP